MEYWENKHFSFFQNRECEYFPCHATKDPDSFNCLFCYCPLYALGRSCGGNFCYTESGIKDCSNCMIPHRRENYGRITDSFSRIVELIKENELAEEQKDAE
ncbi:MAG: cysteine-rich small domain-containing protein [Clostridia bacterium]|nr:cysteine-rich small domain-containing protein [Clostridia bacterium]